MLTQIGARVAALQYLRHAHRARGCTSVTIVAVELHGSGQFALQQTVVPNGWCPSFPACGVRAGKQPKSISLPRNRVRQLTPLDVRAGLEGGSPPAATFDMQIRKTFVKPASVAAHQATSTALDAHGKGGKDGNDGNDGRDGLDGRSGTRASNVHSQDAGRTAVDLPGVGAGAPVGTAGPATAPEAMLRRKARAAASKFPVRFVS